MYSVIIEEIVEVVRLSPQERIQQRTVEQIVVVPVLQVVSGPDHRTQNCRCDSDGTTPNTNQPDNLKKQWRFYKYSSLIERWMCLSMST